MFRDYQNYEVFEDGRIWSKYSKKFLKPATTRDGYQKVCLVDNNGKKHMQYVHLVTWIAIKGEIPKGMQINHIDECKTNNAIWNLELCTPKYNNNYGSHNERSAASRSKRVAAYDKNGELQMIFASTNEAHRNGFNKGSVCNCCRNCYLREGNNVYKGFTWKYLDN